MVDAANVLLQPSMAAELFGFFMGSIMWRSMEDFLEMEPQHGDLAPNAVAKLFGAGDVLSGRGL